MPETPICGFISATGWSALKPYAYNRQASAKEDIYKKRGCPSGHRNIFAALLPRRECFIQVARHCAILHNSSDPPPPVISRPTQASVVKPPTSCVGLPGRLLRRPPVPAPALPPPCLSAPPPPPKLPTCPAIPVKMFTIQLHRDLLPPESDLLPSVEADQKHPQHLSSALMPLRNVVAQ